MMTWALSAPQGIFVPSVVAEVIVQDEFNRTKLDALSKSKGGRPFYLTVSPADTTYLQPAVPSLNLVNMQTYGGSFGLTPQDFTALGF